MKTLIREKKIKLEIARIARKISTDYEGKTVTFVCVLSGAFMFFSELLQKLKNVDSRVVFVKVASYREGMQAGELEFEYESRKISPDENVIIVDDIYDSGQTMQFLLSRYAYTASVKSCILLEKKVPHLYPLDIDYTALKCEDAFIVGFGLDYAEKYRNIPCIKAIESE